MCDWSAYLVLFVIQNEYDIVNCNDIARIAIRVTKPLCVDKYNINRTTGSLIIIDERTNNTVGAGIII